jgi:hypothetical protein
MRPSRPSRLLDSIVTASSSSSSGRRIDGLAPEEDAAVSNPLPSTMIILLEPANGCG